MPNLVGATGAQQVEGVDVSCYIEDVTGTDKLHKGRIDNETETGGKCLCCGTLDAKRLCGFRLVRCNMFIVGQMPLRNRPCQQIRNT